MTNPPTGPGPGPGVRRSLRTAGDAVTVRLARHLDHPPAAVWSACTEPARLSHWFGEVGPVPDVDVDGVGARPGSSAEAGGGGGTGGGLRLGGSAWLWSPEAADGGRISIRHCDPPRRLVVGWSYAEEPASRVELRLTPAGAGAGTDLVLEHTGAGGFEGPEHGAGWETFLAALDAHLATGAGDPADLRWGLLETSLQEVWLALVPGSDR